MRSAARGTNGNYHSATAVDRARRGVTQGRRARPIAWPAASARLARPLRPACLASPAHSARLARPDGQPTFIWRQQ